MIEDKIKKIKLSRMSEDEKWLLNLLSNSWSFKIPFSNKKNYYDSNNLLFSKLEKEKIIKVNFYLLDKIVFKRHFGTLRPSIVENLINKTVDYYYNIEGYKYEYEY